MTCNHAREFDCELELLCRRDGTILAVRGHVNGNIGAYIRSNATIAPRNVVQFFSGPYRIPNIHIESSMLVTNKTPTGTYRAPGRFEGDFFRERLFDIAADDLGIDPVAFRRHNLITKDELPARIGCPHAGPTTGRARQWRLPADTRSLSLGIRLGGEGQTQGQADRRPVSRCRHRLLHRRRRASVRGKTRAWCSKATGSSPSMSAQRSSGRGWKPSASQIAADALELPMERIRIFHGSTTYLHEGFGSFAFALHGDGRLRHHRRRGEAEGSHPHRRRPASELRRGGYRP